MQVTAQNCQQHNRMILCCNVNNTRLPGKKEQKTCLDSSLEGLWVNEMIQEHLCHLDILRALY